MIATMKLTTAVVALGVGLGLGGASADAQTRIPGVEIISGSPTGGWFPIAAMIAELTNANYEGQPLSVIPGAGGVGNPLRVGTGQSDIGISYGPFLALAQQGSNELYQEAFPGLRAIAGMTSNALHVVVAGDTTFAGVASAKPAINVATGPTGSTELFMLQEVFRQYGFEFSDVQAWGGRVERLETSGRSDGWNNRQFDMANFFINPPAAQVVSLMAARDDSRLMTVEDNVAKALIEQWGLLEVVIPAGTYPNQDEDVITLGMPYVYFASEDLDPDIVYNFTKAIAENHERLISGHASFQEWSPEDMTDGLGIELHEGARRYYQERGWL